MTEAGEAPRLREILIRAEPRDFALRRAWPLLVRGLRAGARPGRAPHRLASRAALDRALGSPLRSTVTTPQVEAVKRLLGDLVREASDAEVPAELARRAAQAMLELVVGVVEEPVAVEVSGWPQGLSAAGRARLIGRSEQSLGAVAPLEAACIVRDLDGLSLAGSTLSVRARLPEHTILPPVPRDLRASSWQRRREDPWLPHVDQRGRVGLTPQVLARDQARWLGAGVVIDAFCGCGGNAVAFARAGARVLAVERDPGRADLARQNARALGVARRVEVLCGDARALLPGLYRREPGAALFLDPPWGDWDRRRVAWGDLVPPLLPVDLARAVMLKAPRSFDPATLPEAGRPWSLRYGFGQPSEEEDAGLERVVKLLTLYLPGPARPRGGAGRR